MPVIAIYFFHPGAMDYPFTKTEYFEIYKELVAELESRGIEVYIVRGESYLEKGRFSRGWRIEKGRLVETAGPISADLIFNRRKDGRLPAFEDWAVINNPELNDLGFDKIKTAEFFPEFSPRTLRVDSFASAVHAAEAWGLKNNEKIVLKKNFLTEGEGIVIIPVSDLKENLFENWQDILAQKFLDGSIGIPGLVEGVHDLRITVVNNRPINSFIRKPALGSLLANVAQGGTGKSISLAEVPAEVMTMLNIIIKKLSSFHPSLYSADFMNTRHGYKLIEIETNPGVQHPKWSLTYKDFNNAIVDMLVEAAQQKSKKIIDLS